jgi:hypothetical protein
MVANRRDRQAVNAAAGVRLNDSISSRRPRAIGEVANSGLRRAACTRPAPGTFTRYVTRSDPPQWALVTSWQPAAAGAEPRDPDPAAQRADQQDEPIIVRPAAPDEIDGLALPARGSVLVIAAPSR